MVRADFRSGHRMLRAESVGNTPLISSGAEDLVEGAPADRIGSSESGSRAARKVRCTAVTIVSSNCARFRCGTSIRDDSVESEAWCSASPTMHWTLRGALCPLVRFTIDVPQAGARRSRPSSRCHTMDRRSQRSGLGSRPQRPVHARARATTGTIDSIGARKKTRSTRSPNFRTELKGGQVIHFIHEHGTGPDPLPIILTHGFPGFRAAVRKDHPAA